MKELNEIKKELERQDEERFQKDVYDWGYGCGIGKYGGHKTKNPYLPRNGNHTTESAQWQKGFNDGKSSLMKKKFNCEMTFTPNCNEMMKDILDFFEVEILQGETNKLPDGRIQYLFNASEEKMAIIRKAHWMNDIKDNPQS